MEPMKSLKLSRIETNSKNQIKANEAEFNHAESRRHVSVLLYIFPSFFQSKT